MKIAFVGNFSVPYCSEVHYARTFEKLGHEVIKIQENNTDTSYVYKMAKEADLFFWVHTHGWRIPGELTMREVMNRLNQRGIPTVGYHLDLYMGLKRWKEYENDDYFKVQHFFTVDKLMADWLNQNTETKGHFMPAGVLEDECYLGDWKQRFAHDVIFVGSRNYHEEWPYRPKLVDWLKKTYGDRFGHYGGDGLGVVRGADLNNLYASAKVVVGDTLCIGFDYPEYLSDRIFETTGRGGFIIHPYIHGIAQHFKLGQEIQTYIYDDFEELKKTIDFYIEHDEQREKIRLAGHERTKRDHTYTTRLSDILAILKSEIRQKPEVLK